MEVGLGLGLFKAMLCLFVNLSPLLFSSVYTEPCSHCSPLVMLRSCLIVLTYKGVNVTIALSGAALIFS